MSVVERVRQRIQAVDPGGLDDLLRSLDEPDRAAVRGWVTGARKWFAEDAFRFDYDAYRRDPSGSGFGVAGWCQVMCAIAVCSPVEAVRTIGWRDLRSNAQAELLATRWLEEKPREWAEPFVDAAAAVRMPASESWHGGVSLARLVARGVIHHGLPCPTGETFLRSYLVDEWNRPADVERLRAEPLMPDVIYRMISVGVIANLSQLADAVPALVEEGRLDRARLVDGCLGSLTVDQRVRSQRVVAKVLSALDLRAGDVPGGLAFLTGVIATRDGSVGAVLLPLSLDLVADAAGLEELTRVVAGRKEKKQKRVLLKALRDPGMAERAGLDGVLRALELLAEGQEDAALAQAVARVQAELGAPVDPVEDQAPVAGLWQLDLDPGPEPPWSYWRPKRRFLEDYYLDSLDNLHAGATDAAVALFVHGVANGELTPDALVATCHRLRVGGRLAVTRLVPLIEAAFLAGGLRLVWPAALAVADDLASARRSPAGLPDLLRMLARYAAEVPSGASLPSHLADLASGPGTTVVRLEARALGAALSGVDVADYRPDSSPAEPAGGRGLWAMRVPAPVLARVVDPFHHSMTPIADTSLTYMLDLDLGLGDRMSFAGPRGLPQHDDHLVRWLAVEVQREGAGPVRERVRGIRRGTGVGPAAVALDGWQSGGLDAAMYGDYAPRIWGEMPPGPDRLVFAWWCEQLVRLPTHPGLLGRPDTNLGSVELEGLVERIRSWQGIADAGTLDLVLALTRLRPTVAMSLEGLDGVELWTDPLTGPRFDVVPVLRDWVKGGGLDATELPLELSLVPGLEEADLRGPAGHPDVLARVRPRDPELGAGPPESEFHAQDPWLVDGRISPKMWTKYLLTGMCGDNAWGRDRALRHVVELAQHDGLLDPEVTVPPAVGWLEGGHLPLARFTESVQWVVERGGLRAMWPLALGVGDAAAVRTPKPNGLAVLLGSLADYAPEVPVTERKVPDGLRVLAAAKGSTKSHAAARSLVAQLEGSS